jgi:hypothetical protein
MHASSVTSRRAVVVGAALVLFAFVAAMAVPAGPVATVKGQILAVDVDAKTVALKVLSKSEGADPAEISVAVDEQTKILKGNRPVGLSEVQVGDDAVVAYRKDEGKNVAVSIGIQEKKAS